MRSSRSELTPGCTRARRARSCANANVALFRTWVHVHVLQFPRAHLPQICAGGDHWLTNNGVANGSVVAT
eukprot:COSAG02_NODE_2604_length_8443_cov_6.439593_8_plen_70_part_00